jgi:hypothetical protein
MMPANGAICHGRLIHLLNFLDQPLCRLLLNRHPGIDGKP